MFGINAKAGYFFIQEVGRRLNDGGKTVSLGTSLQNAFTDGYSTYAGAKSPLEHFTRAAAKEFADRQISVNEICRRSEEHTSELQSRFDLVCRLLLEKKKHITACVNSSSN